MGRCFCCCISNTLSSTFAGCMSLRMGLLLLVMFDCLAVFGLVPSGFMHKILFSTGPFAYANLAFALIALYGLLRRNTMCLDVYFWSQFVSFLLFFIAFFSFLAVYVFLVPLMTKGLDAALDHEVVEKISDVLGTDIAGMIVKGGTMAVKMVLGLALLISGNLMLLKWYLLSMINSLVAIVRAGGTGDEYKSAQELRAETALPLHFKVLEPAALPDQQAVTAMGETKPFADAQSFATTQAGTAPASFVEAAGQ